MLFLVDIRDNPTWLYLAMLGILFSGSCINEWQTDKAGHATNASFYVYKEYLV